VTSDPPEKDPTDYAHRHQVNLIAAAFLLVVAIAIGWTVIAFERQQRLERCFEVGRRDCIPIESPPHPGVMPPGR
jgi:hypothetical protein